VLEEESDLERAVREGLDQWREDPTGERRPKKKKKKKKEKAEEREALELKLVRGGISDPTPEPDLEMLEGDEALKFVDELLDSPLGRVWLTDSEATNIPGLGADGKPIEGVIAALPRRKLIAKRNQGEKSPPRAKRVHFEANILNASWRLILWFWAGLRYFVGNFWDSIRGRNTMERRAVRLRLIFESLGPTFIKLGQQLSIRADVLPYTYCVELGKMLDSVKPFPTEQAIQVIERVAGKKLSEIFAVFDPTPIGSASLSCVYQAVRHNGDRVAVKVRRPGIGPMLAADLKALGWLMDFAETMSFVRTGITRNLRIELHTMLMEELNFHREARYTELFRIRAKEKKQTHISAPKVHRDISGEDVLVTEFVTGVFLWEIIAALDQKNAEAMTLIRERGIDPREIAKRMVLAFNWETLENLLFHADPHPANIVIRPDNTIVFIDFGSCGRFSSKTRRLWMQLHHYLNEEDVQGMVECSISLLEPLPPIDLDKFIKEVEALYWDWLYALTDPDAEWWEKASGMMWMNFVGIARNYNIPMNLDTLRLFRATFLYDTIMYRLWREMDLDKEYQHYHKLAAKRSKRRVRKAIRRRVEDGFQVKDYMRMEEMLRMGRQALGRIQHVLDTPSHNFSHMLGKAAFGISMFLKLAAVGMGIHIFAVVGVTLYQSITGHELSIWETFNRIVGSKWYQIIVMLVFLVIVRKALMRFEDLDVEGN
jgi:ubiquinone biosynthesis protein